MSEKRLNGRIVNKHDTQANWENAEDFVPMLGEIILYDIDENYDYERMKVGDGETTVGALPFVNGVISDEELNAICDANIYLASEVMF